MSSQITFPRLKKKYETIFKTDEVNHSDWNHLGRYTRDSMDTRCLCGFKIKNSNLFEHKETGLIYNFGDGCRKNFGVPAIKYFNQTQKNILKEINTLVKDAFDLYKYFQINYKLYLLIQQNKLNNFLKKVIKNFKQNNLQYNLDNDSNSEYDIDDGEYEYNTRYYPCDLCGIHDTDGEVVKYYTETPCGHSFCLYCLANHILPLNPNHIKITKINKTIHDNKYKIKQMENKLVKKNKIKVENNVCTILGDNDNDKQVVKFVKLLSKQHKLIDLGNELIKKGEEKFNNLFIIIIIT